MGFQLLLASWSLIQSIHSCCSGGIGLFSSAAQWIRQSPSTTTRARHARMRRTFVEVGLVDFVHVEGLGPEVLGVLAVFDHRPAPRVQLLDGIAQHHDVAQHLRDACARRNTIAIESAIVIDRESRCEKVGRTMDIFLASKRSVVSKRSLLRSPNAAQALR